MGLRTFLVAPLVSLAVLLGAGVANAQPVRTENVETELVSARASAAPGETVTLVLRQKIRAGWHTYWTNSGDSGEPTRLTWTLPPGFTAGPLLHPAPRVERLGPITTYVHEGEVLYPLAITVPDDAKVGANADLSVKATWLVCDEICIPEAGVLKLSLPVRAEGRDDRRGAQLADEAVAALPEGATQLGYDFAAGDTVRISFPRAGVEANAIAAAVDGKRLRNPVYFPYAQALIDHAAPQTVKIGDGAVRFEIPLSLSFNSADAKGDGLLVAEIEEGGRWTKRSFMFGPPPGEGPLPVAVAARWAGVAPLNSAPPEVKRAAAVLDFIGYILAAFLGGLILNLMPCVFPVLSIKALSLAGGAHAGVARRHGLLFLAGVMATFMALAVALIALKSAGMAVGWGFQLQEPALIGALALLFFALGLNLIGAFEIGGGVQNIGGGLAEKGGDVGAFATGMLAVIAATPCTAPFMAGALGWAATQPPAASLAVFAGLGLGFAAPFTALSFAPGLQKLMPKPGAWMDRAKQFLAFPMFAAAVWLVWVLSVQTGATGTLALLSVFVALAFVIWAWRQGTIWRVVALCVLLAVAVVAWRPMTNVVSSIAPAKAENAEPWSPERLAELRAGGAPVFVNFTAAWCVSCKANEIVALSQPGVQKAFAAGGVAYLKADWTARDAVIAAELAAHGRSGVPLYLYYAPGAAEPVVLPQLLTERTVLNAIGAAGVATTKETP
jgi:DsbC/DsbD-like thiol-disulfide interchange protein/cytochrome c biogenesis protein CcdA